MSLCRRVYMTLTCDAGCGARIDTEAGQHIHARVEAGLKGWRYIDGVWLLDRDQRDKYHVQKDKEQTLRSVDVCPNCDPPAEGSRITKADLAS